MLRGYVTVIELIQEVCDFLNRFDINNIYHCQKLLYYCNCVKDEENNDIKYLIYNFLEKQCIQLEHFEKKDQKEIHDNFIPIKLSAFIER